MRNVMGAIPLSFLVAVGSGSALANSNPAEQHPSSSSAAGQPQGKAPGTAPVGFAEEEVTSAPLTVERIDKKNRNLVLRATDGTQSTVPIPAGTPGFDSLKQGDKVQIDYYAAEVFEPAQPANGANQTGSTSNHGNQAGGTSSGATNGKATNGKVRNIHKVGNGNETGQSGKTGQMGSSGATSGTNQHNQ